MQCIIMENTLIKLTLHDETKKRAHDSQIVRGLIKHPSLMHYIYHMASRLGVI